MDSVVLLPGERSGVITAPPSKSHAHRLLICAALSDKPVSVDCGDISLDVAATKSCLNALCADIGGRAELFCGESGTTLRFLLPLCGALGKDAVFHTEGRLSERPIYPLDAVLRSHGMEITRHGRDIACSGRLTGGIYELAGDISSQFISGLLFALPLLEHDSVLRVTGRAESRPYIEMTERVIAQAGIEFEKCDNEYRISGNQRYRMSGNHTVEGDWSGAAFFLCMGALSEGGVSVKNLPFESAQGDKEIVSILRRFGADVIIKGDEITVKRGELRGIWLDASQIPDLVPVISVLAAAAKGESRIYNAARLRLKESDRLKATAALINGLGGNAVEAPDGLIIHGGTLTGGTAHSFNDHRIAMSAAAAASVCTEPVTLLDPDCTAKSFPRFWEYYHGTELK